jgi:hypothetical protein
MCWLFSLRSLVVNFSNNVGGPPLVGLLWPIVLRPDDR